MGVRKRSTRAHLRATRAGQTALALTTAGPTFVTFPVIERSGGGIATSGNGFSVPRSGLYVVNVCVYVSSRGGTTNGRMNIVLRVAGTPTLQDELVHPPGLIARPIISSTYNFPANTSLEVVATPMGGDGGANPTVDGSATVTYFELTELT